MGLRAALLAIMAFPLCLRGELLAVRTYTTADGLAADEVGRIVADSRGFLWFCTPEGLSRFDGYRIVNFGTAEGLPHRTVGDLLETRSGEYLVATARGLCRLRPGNKENKLTTYLPGSSRLENYTTALREAPSGRIWCGTVNGLFEMLTGPKFRPQPLPERRLWDRVSVTDVLEDRGGKLWVASSSGLDVIGKDGAARHFGPQDGFPNEWVNALLLDQSGRVWAGTRGGLALMRNADVVSRCGVERVYAGQDSVRNIQALAEGPDGSIWIGSTVGLSRLLPGSGQAAFQHFTRANGLTDRQIYALAVDKAGNIWAGTEAAGVMRIQRAGFTTFHEEDGLACDRVWSVMADRAGTVLAVTTSEIQKGLVSIFDGARFHTISPRVFREQATWGNHQMLLESRTGEWWGATQVGLCRYAPMKAVDLAGKRPQACYARDFAVFKIFEDSKGGIWASAQSRQGDRLIRWDPVKRTIRRFTDGPSRTPLLVNAFAEDHQGNIWMGLYDHGEVFRYDGRHFTRFDQSAGVPPGAIQALLVDHGGRLWIGSSGGLGFVENPNGASFRVRVYDTTNGLASNTIHCIVEDNAGRIYAGTQKGVDRLHPATGHVKHFSVADGLASGRTTSAFRDASGSLWFATTQGLSRLVPTDDRPPATPTVRVTDLRVGRERYAVSQVGETFIHRVELQPSENQLQVEFVGFSDEPEESLRYTYKLEGGDSEWRAPGRDHQANYPGLAPGKYRFLVKAVNSEGQESPTPAEIDFTVLPPFWKRWWFEALALAALAALIYAMHRYRIAQLLQVERIRTAIATDLHDDIGASLSQIAILSEVARLGNETDKGVPEEPLRKIASLARELVDSMSDIVWSIRSEPDGMDSLVRRMREFALDVLASRAIGFELRVPESSGNLHLKLQSRRQLFLIYKECIHNVARHSGCTRAVAELSLADRDVVLSVRDNGRGFGQADPPPSHGGTGIPSMKRRAGNVGGTVQWLSTPGGGCTVIVRIPV